MSKSEKIEHVALLGLGNSQLDYHHSLTHSAEYDEVWAVNSMCAVVNADRVFMMDPASRFFDTDDAGGQTKIMRKILPTLTCPIYSCELDERVPPLSFIRSKRLSKLLGAVTSTTPFPMPLHLPYGKA